MTPENRQSFRITEEIYFQYRQVDADTLATQPPEALFPDSAALAQLSEYKRLETETSALLASLADQQRSIGDALTLLNRKIDLLARQILEPTRDQPQQLTRVNLGEGGLAFSGDQILPADTLLAMQLIFPPAGTGITCYGQVTRCEQLDSHLQVAVRFIQLTPSQDQILWRQIMQSQIHARRLLQQQEK